MAGREGDDQVAQIVRGGGKTRLGRDESDTTCRMYVVARMLRRPWIF